MAEGNTAEWGSFILTPWIWWEMDPAANTDKQEHPQEFGIFSSSRCLSSPGSNTCDARVPGKGRTDETRKSWIPVPMPLASPQHHPRGNPAQLPSSRETHEILGWAGGSSTSPGQGIPPGDTPHSPAAWPGDGRGSGTSWWPLEWPREGGSPSRWRTALPEEFQLCREQRSPQSGAV